VESLAHRAGYCLCVGVCAAGSHDRFFSDVVWDQRMVSARGAGTRDAGGDGSGVRAVDAARRGDRRHCELPPITVHSEFLDHQFHRCRIVLRGGVSVAPGAASGIAVPAFERRLPLRGCGAGRGDLRGSAGSALAFMDPLDPPGRLHKSKLELCQLKRSMQHHPVH
jgi:hypothetical protein